MAQLGGDPAVAIAPAGLGDGPDLGHHRVIIGTLGICYERRTGQAHQFAPPSDRDGVGPVITDVGALFCNRPFSEPL